jgi:hypothetical protein
MWWLGAWGMGIPSGVACRSWGGKSTPQGIQPQKIKKGVKEAKLDATPDPSSLYILRLMYPAKVLGDTLCLILALSSMEILYCKTLTSMRIDTDRCIQQVRAIVVTPSESYSTLGSQQVDFGQTSSDVAQDHSLIDYQRATGYDGPGRESHVLLSN